MSSERCILGMFVIERGNCMVYLKFVPENTQDCFFWNLPPQQKEKNIPLYTFLQKIFEPILLSLGGHILYEVCRWPQSQV